MLRAPVSPFFFFFFFFFFFSRGLVEPGFFYLIHTHLLLYYLACGRTSVQTDMKGVSYRREVLFFNQRGHTI